MKAFHFLSVFVPALMAAVPARAQTTAPVATFAASQAAVSAAPATQPTSIAPQAFTLATALESARKASLTMGSAQARIAAAEARLRGAGAMPGTILTLAHAYGKDTGGFDEDVLLSQTIEIGKRGPRVKGAKFEREAVVFDRAGVGTDLDFAVRSAYYGALQADVESKLAADSLASAQTFQNAAQAQFTAGDVPRANVVRSSIELARAQAALVQAQSDRDVRYAALRSLLGLADETPMQLGETLGFTTAGYDLASLEALALQSRADVLSARAQQNAKLANVQVAKSANRPDAFIEARRAAISRYTDLPNGSSVRVGVVIPLFDFGRNRAATDEAKAAASEQQAVLKETERTARLDVATTYAHLLAAQSAVQSFTSGRLAQSKELLDMAQTGYERGANSYLELLDAQTVFRNEQADYARSLAAWNTAHADLERAVGGKLP